MEKHLRLLSITLMFILSALCTYAQTGANIDWECLGTTGITLETTSSANSISHTFTSSDCQGNGFTVTTNGTPGSTGTLRVFLGHAATSEGEYLRLDKTQTTSTFTSAKISSTSGATFTLTKIAVTPSVATPGSPQSITLHAMRGNTEVGSVTTTTVTAFGFQTLSGAQLSAFTDIDNVVFTPNGTSPGGVGIDVFQTASAAYTSPGTIEYFEGATANATVFTNAATGLGFNLSGGIFVENTSRYGVDNHNPPTSTTAGSDFYLDNFGATATGQTEVIKSANKTLFTVKSLYAYPSSLATGDHPTNDGTLTFIGKKGGVQQFSVNKSGFKTTVSLGTDLNGFSLVNFSEGTDVSNTLIDELDVVLNASYQYLAIDNFAFTATPNIINNTATAITGTGATLNASVNPSGSAVSAISFDYGTSSTLATSTNVAATPSTLGSAATGTAVSAGIASLTPGTTYYYRANATNANGINNNSTINSFVTTAAALATLTTSAVTTFGSTTATFAGNVSADGGANITEKGIVYGTGANPTTANTKLINGTATGTGAISVNAAGLAASTTYHIRAYAINSAGTAYGTDQSFTTTSGGITLSTSPTLTFSNATGFGDNIAQDGEGGSVTISDLDLQTYPINSSAVKLIADPLQYHDSTDPAWSGYPAIITYGDTNPNYGWAIKSVGGGNFSLASLSFLNWGDWTGIPIKIEGFDNGTSVGSLVFNGNTTGSFIPLSQTSGTPAFKLPATFGNVDEVRLYSANNGPDSYISLNNIQVSTPVVASTTTVNAINTASTPTTTSAATVNYTVTFGAAVSGLTASNFSLTTTGVTGVSVGTPTGSGTSWTVPVNTGTGNGTITLNLANATGLTPGIGTTLPFAGQTYTMVHPLITETGTLNAFNSCAGAASAAQSFTVAGSNLTADITIAPPAGFEVSSTSATAGFTTGTLTLTQSTGTVNTTTIYARLTNVATGTPSGNIALSSTGATGVNVAASGTVQAALSGNTITAPAVVTFNASGDPAVITGSTPSGGSGTYSYQWQSSADNTIFTNINGATSASYDPPAISATTYYQRLVTSGACITPSVSNVVTITIHVNHNPVGTADSYTISKNEIKTGNVLTNDTDPDGDILTASLVTGPVHGAIILNADGSFTYTPNADYAGGDTFNYQVCDNGTPSLCNTATATFNIGGVNAAPVVTTTGGSTVFTSGDNMASTPVVINSGITVTDADNINLAGATVSITGNLHSGEDILAFTSTGGITGNYNIITGTLVLNGAATVAQYQAVLRSVTYTNTAITPNAATRTISFSVSDGIDNSTATKTVTITATDQTPIVTTSGGTTAYTHPTAVAIDNGITVSDLDNTTLTGGTISLSAGFQPGDKLAFVSTGNITGSYNASTGVLTLTAGGAASLAQWQAALQSVTFSTTATAPSTGNRTATFAVSDGTKTSAQVTQTISVALPGITLSPSTLPGATVGVAYSQTITASGGSSYAYAVTTGALPAGLTLNGTTGALTGTPTAVGSYSFTITAADASTASASVVYTMVAAPPVTLIAPGTLPSGGVGVAYNQTITASGGIAPYTYTITAGALPAGLTLNGTTGALTGTATAGGTFNFTVTAIGSSTGIGAPHTGARAYSLTIAAPTMALSPASLPAGTLNTPYSATLSLSGGTAPYHYNLSGTLPAGITLNPTTGELSGTPTAAGTFGLMLGGTDSSTGTGPFSFFSTYNLVINSGGQTITFGSLVAATYGDAPVTLTGTASSGLAVSYNSSNPAVATVSGNQVTIIGAGSTVITASQAGNSNYNAAADVPQTLTVNAKAITVTADAKTKTYGSADPALTYQITTGGALVTGDSFTGSLTRDAGENAAAYAIKQGTLALNSNYTLTYAGANLTIGAKAITVTADAKTKTYGAADPALTYQITTGGALVTGDSFTGSLTRDAGENAAAYAIKQGTLALNSNYTLTYAGANLTIGAKAITVTADAKTKTYGAADPALTYQITTGGALITGDSFTGSLTRDAGENVAAYAIKQGTLALNSNYTLTYAGANLTIGTKAITVTADAKTKTYGSADPALTYQITTGGSLITGDSFSGSLTRDAGENVGNYNIKQGTLALNSNYTLTYAGANLTIGAKAITVTVDAKTKTYGSADPALTYQITTGGALVTGDTFSGSLTRDAGENVGNYNIKQGTLALNSNYTLTYAGANLTIGTKAITVTADAKTKTYGSADPALTYQVTTGALVTGDTFTGSLTRDAGENVGSYNINQGTLALSSNYTLTYAGAKLAIGTRAIAVTADAKSKTFGDADPALTYKITTGALVGTDAFTGTLTRDAGEAVGSYAIKQGTLALSSNYALSYNGANLVINSKTLTITADNKSKVYGSANPTLTVTYSGFVGTDNSSSLTTQPVISTTATASSGAGTYPISVSGAAIPNYTIVYTPGTLTVNKAGLTVTADNKSRNFGVANPALTVTYSGFVNGDDATKLTTTPLATTTATATTAPGNYNITAGGGVSGNYNFTYITGTLTVIPLTNANLNSLAISAGTLAPAFATGTFTYKVSVENRVDYVTLTPVFDATATARINGSSTANGSPSFNIPLNVGDNTITLVVTAQDGVTKNTYTITVYRGIAPISVTATNILTPNGDGKNDFWVIKDIQLYPNNSVTVYDKGGRVIYSKHGYSNDWDGTLRGAPLSEGTYYYTVDLGVGQPQFKGYITILRSR